MGKLWDICGYSGCTLGDMHHDHHIHPGDFVEWKSKTGQVMVSRVLACFMISNWAFFEVSGSKEKVRYDAVKRLSNKPV